VEKQKKSIEDYINKYNRLDEKKYYIDLGYSGLNFNRPAFKELVSDIEKNEISYIYVTNFSRISRKTDDLSDFMDKKLKSKKVKLISVFNNGNFSNIHKEVLRKCLKIQKNRRSA